MNKRICSLLLAIVMVIGLLPMSVFAAEENTADLEISTVEGLKAFAEAVNAGDDYAGKTVVLTADIDLTGEAWTPITSFAGTFDGQEHTISNLTNAACLFNTVTAEGVVQNLKLDKVTADFASNVAYGFLALTVNGKVNNCHISNVTINRAGYSNAKGGALIKSVTGNAVVENCSATNVTLTHTGSDSVDGLGGVFGGAAGNAVIRNCSGTNVTMSFEGKFKRVGGFIEGVSGSALVENCTLTGIKLGSKDSNCYPQEVGGFAATVSGGSVVNCAVKDVTIESVRLSVQTGGFVGQVHGGAFSGCDVINATFDIATRGSNQICSTAGFCGQTNSNTDKSFTDCSVTGLDMKLTGNLEMGVGGFLTNLGGNGAVNISGCSVEGEIDATGNTNNQPVGGFLGNLGWGGTAVATISDSNADVQIEATGSVGGFVGQANSGNATLNVTDCTAGNMDAEDEGFIGTGESDKVVIVIPVAEVNGTKYGSLAEAIEAGAGQTITLLSDVEVTAETTFNMANGTVLDLNGFTFKGDDGKAIFAGTNFTIKNGNVTGVNGSTLDYYPITIDSASTKALRSASNIVVEGLTFTNAGLKIRGGATVTLKDNTITANQNKFKYAVWAYGSANVTIESGTYFGGKNGYDVFEEGKVNITLYGGTYKVKNNAGYVAADYRYVENADGTYTVKAPYVEASVNGIGYDSLQAAINAANSGDTVTLLVNVTAAEQIVINKSLTLDLGEFTITGNSADAVLRVYSVVVDTVIDVTINATTGGIVNEGTGYAIYAGEDLDGGNDAERTNLTINGGNYMSAGTDCIKQIMGLCTVNGGSYKSSYGRTVLNGKQWYGSEFKINGGSFYGFNPACVSVWTGFDGKDYTNFYHQHDIIAEGKTATYADGWYTVVDGTYTAVAETKSLCYPSLETALVASINLNDVANLGEIKLVANDTLDLGGETITLPKGLVIDLNGNTLTIPYQKAMFAGENITIKNGTITNGNKQLQSYGLYLMNGSFTLENVKTTNGINVQTADVTMKDVTVTNPNNKYYAVYSGGNVTIKSGTFKNTSKTHAIVYGNVTIEGGTFSKLPAADKLAADRHVVKSGSWYTVYEGFDAALAAAKAGDTVYLMSDINVAETIIINKALTLDLGAYTINSTANVAVYCNGADLTINGTTGGIYTTGTVAVGQDNGTCTINGGSFKATGNTHDVANGQPVKYRYTLDNSEGGNGAFVINGGSFYGFTPACMFINYNDGHDHDSISEGKVAVLDENGWFTVAEGTLTHTIVCECDYPAPSHQYCFTSYEQAELFIKLFTNCEHDKIVEIAE